MRTTLYFVFLSLLVAFTSAAVLAQNKRASGIEGARFARNAPRNERRAQPSIHHVPRAQPSIHHVPRAQPSIHHVPRAQPSIHHVPRAQPSIHHVPRAQPSIHHVPRAQPSIHHVPRAQPSIHHEPRAQPSPLPGPNSHPVPRGLDEQIAMTNFDSILCPFSLSACPIVPLTKLPNSFEEWRNVEHECVEFETDLQSCGGCASIDISHDCTAIPDARNVACISGGCQVQSCEKGYSVSPEGKTCVAN